MKIVGFIFLFIIHLTLFSGIGRADSLALDKMIQEGQIGTAIEQLMPLADQGDMKAQELLSRIFLHHMGDDPDIQSAVDWLRRAAPFSATLQFQLYDLLTKNQRTPENQEERLSLLRQAAQAGHPEAQAHLGMHYAIGTEIEVDLQQSMKWLFLASKNLPKDSNINMLEALSWVAAQLGKNDLAMVEQQVKTWRTDYASRRAKNPLPLLETPFTLFKKATEAVQLGQTAKAEDLFLLLAMAGDKDSQTALANLLSQNPNRQEEARHWLTESQKTQ